jgi:hypothetical protein
MEYIELEKIFVAIPKTGSMSINDIIMCNPRYKIKYHVTVLKKDKTLDLEQLNIKAMLISYEDKFSFAVVRNPYDRFISGYNMVYENNEKISFEEVVNNLENIIKTDNFAIIFVPQHLFICDEHDNILINKVCRFENLYKDLLEVDDIFVNLKHTNASVRRSDAILTEEIKNKIYNVYRKDFEIFGYDK